MKVYVAIRYRYNRVYNIIGVFSSMERAIELSKDLDDDILIEEMEVQ